jgi:hypothetical protein
MENLIPTIKDYTHFLECATKKFNIDINSARNLYGKFTYLQWHKLLN